jgi:hypothetical protein
MPERCGNCGVEGTLEHVKDVTISEQPTTVSYGNGHEEEVSNQRILHIQRCKACAEPTLSTYRYIDGWSDPSDYIELKRLFPPKRDVSDLPPRVRARYTAMLELLHAPDVFAVRAGKLLEAVCSDNGIATGNLGPRLDELVKGGTVPKPLADQAHLVRKYRNVGGHDDDADVEAGDVPLIRGFAEALLDFLYWGPAELERGSAALAARLAASSS